MKAHNYTYQTKNLINGKTYIGVHSTNNINDGYIGSGTTLKSSIRKHGKKNFRKVILCFFDSAADAYEEEKYLVNESWVKRDDNYNMCVGGVVAYKRTKESIAKGIKSRSWYVMSNETKKRISESNKGKHKRTWTEEEKKAQAQRMVGNTYSKGIKHTEEARMNISAANPWRGKFSNRKGCKVPPHQLEIMKKMAQGESNPNAKKLINVKTGEIFGTLESAVKTVEYGRTSFYNRLGGVVVDKGFHFEYYNEEKHGRKN
jgi:hypothetical protein